MSEADVKIENVSDTALWVAVYRARESQRGDALFQDPLAAILAGSRAATIANQMSSSKITEWTVVIRTYIIDNYIKEAILEGYDTIINLGCGLDTRPYRLDVPSHLKWVEVDFPHMIEFKKDKLAKETPRCHLERYAVDLSDNKARAELLTKLAGNCEKALILTEGVIPYLTEDQVAALAMNLAEHPSFRAWLVEYLAPFIYGYLRTPKRMKEMQNAPFRFFPANWFAVFEKCGWHQSEIRYIPEVTVQIGREMPYPWWAKLIYRIFGDRPNQPTMKSSGYARLMRR